MLLSSRRCLSSPHIPSTTHAGPRAVCNLTWQQMMAAHNCREAAEHQRARAGQQEQDVKRDQPLAPTPCAQNSPSAVQSSTSRNPSIAEEKTR